MYTVPGWIYINMGGTQQLEIRISKHSIAKSVLLL